MYLIQDRREDCHETIYLYSTAPDFNISRPLQSNIQCCFTVMSLFSEWANEIFTVAITLVLLFGKVKLATYFSKCCRSKTGWTLFLSTIPKFKTNHKTLGFSNITLSSYLIDHWPVLSMEWSNTVMFIDDLDICSDHGMSAVTIVGALGCK